MSGKECIARAIVAMQQGRRDECLAFMAKACGEFGDDLTQFTSEIQRPAPTAARIDGSTPQAENTIAPSLASSGSSDFLLLSRRLARQIAVASSLEDGVELDEDVEPADESFADEFYSLGNGDDGVDEDEDDEALASVISGPIRYKS